MEDLGLLPSSSTSIPPTNIAIQFRVLCDKVLRKLFGLKKDKYKDSGEKLNNEEFLTLYYL
jgi:hypothetical protein